MSNTTIGTGNEAEHGGMRTLICACHNCKTRIVLTECCVDGSDKTWFHFSCNYCGADGYINKDDYIRWYKAYRHRHPKQ